MVSLSMASQVGAVELSVKADAHRALIVEGSPTTVTVTVSGKADEQGKYQLHQQVVNRYGEVAELPVIEIELKDQWQQKVDVPVEYYGPTTYKAWVVKDGEGQVIARDEQFLIKPVPVPRLTREQRDKSVFGTCLHWDADWKVLAAMGIHWARDYSWGWLGHAENWPVAANRMNFANVEPSADSAGITILPIMQQAFRTPDKKFFIEDTDKISAAYKRLSTALPQLKYWELDNEADLVHRSQDSDDYRKWFETYLKYIVAADKGLKEAGNGAKVVLNGEAGIHPERAQLLIDKVGDHFDVVNYHFYCGAVAPELSQEDINTGAENRPRKTSFLDSVREINQIAKRAGKEAWLTEIGWSARSGAAVGDRLQSAYLQRIYLLARWAGTDKVFWFWDRELGTSGRFSSMELIDYKGKGAKPAGAAMAAVSKFTAQAEYLGSVDIGDDRWCLIFRRPEGGFLAAAWAVQNEYDFPQELASAAEAYEMYGNPLREKKLTAEPAYVMLDTIPAGWQRQLAVELVGPTVINVYRGTDTQVDIRVPAEGEISFSGLSEGIEPGDVKADGEVRSATLRVLPSASAGSYPAKAVVKGDGWEKSFALNIRVRPAVDVVAAPFVAGQPTTIELRNLIDQATEVKFQPGSGQVQPETVPLSANGSARATYTAPADAAASVPLTVTLANGATQQYWIRPRDLVVPQAGEITLDGDLSDWPAGGEIPANALRVEGPIENFSPSFKVAWSGKGLYVASTIPVGENFKAPERPEDFWEWTSVELSILAAPEDQRDPARQHLFWFVPQQENGTWRVYSGEWQKTMPDGSKQTLKDDKRFASAMKYDGQNVIMEVLIPNDVLGGAPSAGAMWPMTVHAKKAVALSPRTLGVWPGGRGGAFAGWGRLRFAE